MNIDGTLIYQATAEVTQPWCISFGDNSITYWIEDGRVTGALSYTYRDGRIIDVKGVGVIPAEYVAHEESMRI